VFVDDEARNRKGYIPRDVVEGELGIKIGLPGWHTWFTSDECARMRAHPEWCDTEPPESAPSWFSVAGLAKALHSFRWLKPAIEE
jgi:hypothetical protein